MISLQAKPVTLADWLTYIEALHPKSIEMGLDRVKLVVKRLNLEPAFPIITVAGTNGKGSTCAMLESIYSHAGYQVGCYTSPHLIYYNERVSVNNSTISDEALCIAFAAVEQARGEIALTYFEMGTLAAVWHFVQQKIDVAILEVGLGGRLDAVNAFEPTCSIVTSVDLDHIEYLGDTREKIGYEKAGIFRAGKPAICGDANPPQCLLDYAQEIGANLLLIGHAFNVVKQANDWLFNAGNITVKVPKLNLHGDFQLANAASALCAIHELQTILPVPISEAVHALSEVKLAGRFQILSKNPTVIADVAHNPHAAASLVENLTKTPCKGRTLAVCAMLADKDIEGVIALLIPHINVWYLADTHHARGAKALQIKQKLSDSQNSKEFNHVSEALNAACKEANKNDRIIVFGSFYTVADAIQTVAAKSQP